MLQRQPVQNAGLLEFAQPRREDVGGDAEVPLEIPVAQGRGAQPVDDEQRPPLTDGAERRVEPVGFVGAQTPVSGFIQNGE